MGGEVSSESGKAARVPTITRTSSLKDMTTTTPADENANNIGVSNATTSSKNVKRSSTFTGGVRPQIIRRSKKKSKQATATQNREAYVSDEACIDVINEEAVEIYENNLKKRTESTTTEDLFIPTKRTYEKPRPSSVNSNKSDKSREFADDKQDIRTFDRSSYDDRCSLRSSPSVSLGSGLGSSPSRSQTRLSSSSLDEEVTSRHVSRSRSESDKTDVVSIGHKDYSGPKDEETKEKTPTIARRKSSEKRSKLARSKSVGCPPELDALLEERERDEEDGKSLRGNDKNLAKSLEGISRSSSECHRQREHHVQRSAHYSAEIQRLKENRVKTPNELSTYGQDFILNITNAQKTPPPKERRVLRQNEFFDTWVKNQSERIEKLADALRGDELKLNELRRSFRGREVKTDIMQKLPARPKSDKLPRRHVTRHRSYLSSDTEDEFDLMKMTPRSVTPTARLKLTDDAKLKKQLSDTFSLLDSYFENSKKDLPEYQRSRSSDLSPRSSATSSYRISSGALLSEEDEIVEKTGGNYVEIDRFESQI